MPVIMAGIRTAMVLIIGTATLAAFIGGGGLGDLILLGIDRNNTSLILIGAIPAALLAILFDFILKKMEGFSIKQIGIIVSSIVIGGVRQCFNLVLIRKRGYTRHCRKTWLRTGDFN